MSRASTGKPPAPIDPAVQKKVIGDEKPVTARPGDLLAPEMDEVRKKVDALGPAQEGDRGGLRHLRALPVGRRTIPEGRDQAGAAEA